MKMKLKRLLGILLSILLVLGAVPGMSMTAYAEDAPDVTWDGDTPVTEDAELGAVTVTADLTVTIAEGKTLEVLSGINAEGHTLTVAGKGTLIINGATGSNGVDGDDYTAGAGKAGGYGFAGNIIVDGATVTVTGGTGGIGGNDGSGGYRSGSGGNGVVGNVTVNSGSIEVTGGTGGNGGDGPDLGGFGGNGGIGVNGTVTVTGGSATLAGGTGGNGDDGYDCGGSGGNGGIGVNGTVTVTGGSATLAGGIGGEAGSGSNGDGDGENGENGIAVSGTITGLAKESDDNTNWTAVSGTTSDAQYVKVTLAIYPLWVGGVQVTSTNADNILGDNTTSYDDSTKTLTLNGATITDGYTADFVTNGIYYDPGNDFVTLNINLGTGTTNISNLDYGIGGSTHASTLKN